MERKTGVVKDNRYLDHKTGVHHVEIPQRLAAVYGMLDRSGLSDRLHVISPRLASLEEINRVHDLDYIERIIDTSGEPYRYLDPDTVTSENTCITAFLAAGGVIEAVRAVMSDEVNNSFAFIRPPGHHAERNRQMGFCIFNNIAVAVEYARKQFGLRRILIVDWDVHHPNGTQHIFEHSDEVLVFSTHRYPFFPGSGSANEVGYDKGRGYTVNVPLAAHSSDSDYVSVYKNLLLPLGMEFKPQLVLVSAGFDTHYDDPIGGMKLTEKGYSYMTSIVREIAEKTCRGRFVIVLEGGYDLGAIRKSSRKVLDVMIEGLDEKMCTRMERQSESDAGVHAEAAIEQVKDNHRQYWKSFSHG